MRLLNASTAASFVMCSSGGRAGVMDMMAPFAAAATLPVSALADLTCYLVHDTAQASR